MPATTRRGARGDGIGVAGAQVVEDDDVVAALEQPSRDDTSDVTGSAGDQELHAGAVLVG